MKQLHFTSLNAYLFLQNMPDYHERFEKIMAYLSSCNSDAILLQEIGPVPREQLIHRLKANYCIYYAGADNVLWKRRLGLRVLGSGLMMLLHRRHEHGFVSAEHRSYIRQRPREFYIDRSFMNLRFRLDKKIISLANTHLTAYPQFAKYRLKQMRQLNKHMSTVVADYKFLGGDFNFRPDSNEHKIMNGAGWTDTETKSKIKGRSRAELKRQSKSKTKAKAKSKSSPTKSKTKRQNKAGGSALTPPTDYIVSWAKENPYYDQSEAEGKLDYFWGESAREGWSVQSYLVEPLDLSDHYPVQIEVSLR